MDFNSREFVDFMFNSSYEEYNAFREALLDDIASMPNDPTLSVQMNYVFTFLTFMRESKDIQVNQFMEHRDLLLNYYIANKQMYKLSKYSLKFEHSPHTLAVKLAEYPEWDGRQQVDAYNYLSRDYANMKIILVPIGGRFSKFTTFTRPMLHNELAYRSCGCRVNDDQCEHIVLEGLNYKKIVGRIPHKVEEITSLKKGQMYMEQSLVVCCKNCRKYVDLCKCHPIFIREMERKTYGRYLKKVIQMPEVTGFSWIFKEPRQKLSSLREIEYRARKPVLPSLVVEGYRVPSKSLKVALNKQYSPFTHQSLEGIEISEQDLLDYEREVVATSRVKLGASMTLTRDEYSLLQADFEDHDYFAQENRLIQWFGAWYERWQNRPIEVDVRKNVSRVEDMVLLNINLAAATNVKHVILAWITFAKSFFGINYSSDVLHPMQEKFFEIFPLNWWTNLFNPTQGPGDMTDVVEDWLSFTRNVLDNFEMASKTAIYKKFHSFFVHCFAHSIFVGGDLEKFANVALSIEEESYKKISTHGGKLLFVCVDLFHFMIERGYQCVKLGSLHPILHTSKAYDKWYMEVSDVIAKSAFISNPEPHGFTLQEFLATVHRLEEEGEAMYKLSKAENKLDSKFIYGKLSQIKYIRAGLRSRKVAMQNRRAPLGVLLHGETSVGKSGFANQMYVAYAKRFDLPMGDEYKYIRNPIDKYWVNFLTQQWFVLLDDIAAFNPDIMKAQGDPSIMESLQIFNNVPFVPIQADIDDKGKTPFRAELVIATTNTMNLNLQHYFNCPAAVARRLPVVLSIKPKPEYATEDGRLDPSKCNNQEGFDDYWIIEVYNVVCNNLRAQGDTGRVPAYKLLKTYTCIYEFYDWFLEYANIYRSQQTRVEENEKRLADLELCKICFRPVDICVCTETQCDNSKIIIPDDVTPIRYDVIAKHVNYIYEAAANAHMKQVSWFRYMTARVILSLYLSLIYTMPIFLTLIPMEILFSFLISSLPRKTIEKVVIPSIGDRIRKKLGHEKKWIKIAAVVTSTAVLAYISKQLFSYLFSSSKDASIQQARYYDKPVEAVEKEPVNVWKKEDYVVCGFDVSRTTRSWKGLTIEQVHNIVAKNVIAIKTRVHNSFLNKAFDIGGVAFCIKGNIYVTNAHNIPFEPGQVEPISISIVHDYFDQQPSPNVTLRVDTNKLEYYKEMDLVFFQLLGIPPKRDLSDLLVRESWSGFVNGALITRSPKGEVIVKRMINGTGFSDNERTIEANAKELVVPYKVNTKVYAGVFDPITITGDCGSPLIGHTGSGPVILGIHYLGSLHSPIGFSNRVTYELASHVIQNFDFVIVAGEMELGTQSCSVEVIPLHYKSPLRYFDKGTCYTYGSVSIPRAKPKSRVTKTPICDALSRRGFKITHGAPVMSGWKVKRNALEPMLNCVNKMDPVVLEACTDSFIESIIERLPEGWEDMLHVLDDFEAVNGCPGVAYIDALPRSTSAGHPYNKSKKYFFDYLEPQRGHQHPIQFNDEIMANVENILSLYERGIRAYPVFRANLKDELRSFKKIKEEKTRVFSSSPVAWSIVIRKLFLPFTRLMMHNKFIFEHSVGTNCCSMEWTEIIKHMTNNYDPSRINNNIAGDYGQFDKSMPAIIILCAFRVIIEISRRSGKYPPEVIVAMEAAAIDMAFGLVEFFGDLVMFFGVQQSGHPLTVFINSLANSIYMRYAYYQLHPQHDVSTFNELVNLTTYGDDNWANADEKASWFNHTAIQEVFAKVGIVYTMAEKDAVSVPYIPIQQVTFLQRSWVWDEDLQAYAAPLKEESIVKGLMMHVLSKVDSQEFQILSAVESAVRAYFMHGRSKFLEMRSILMQAVIESGLEMFIRDSTFPTWERLHLEFKEGKLTSLPEVDEGGELIPPETKN